MSDETGPRTAAPAAPWAKIARARGTTFDGWIAMSLLAVTAGVIGLASSVHTDGGPPLQSGWPLAFGMLFVVSAAVLAASIAGSLLNRSVLAALEASLEASPPAYPPEPPG